MLKIEVNRNSSGMDRNTSYIHFPNGKYKALPIEAKYISIACRNKAQQARLEHLPLDAQFPRSYANESLLPEINEGIV